MGEHIASELAFKTLLDRLAAQGEVISFWWRDDDAIAPSPALSKLLDQARRFSLPVTLAVIPAFAVPELAERLRPDPLVTIAIHGWSHENHASSGRKKQELGDERPADLVLQQLAEGLAKLKDMFGPQCLPMLVPPWNRISPALETGLADLGFEALSVFGKEREGAPLPLLNTHLDVMDWHNGRVGRDSEALFGELVHHITLNGLRSIGLLTHHLVHDGQVDAFLQAFFSITATHPACRWFRPAMP